MKPVLCADIGTSSFKAALITTEGTLLAYRRETYAGPAPACWLDAFFRAAGGLAAQCPSLRAAALVISGNGPTLTPVTAAGESLTPLSWFSRGETPPGFTGPSLFLPKVRAFKTDDPAAWDRAALLLSSQEWLSHALGAEPVTALPQAAYAPFYWDEEQCAALGLDCGKFPPFVPMGSCIGTTKEGSRPAVSFLLPAGTPIIAGGPDFIMALIGTAALEPGMICDRAGSSEGINLCLDENAWRFLREKRRTGRLDPAIRLLPHAAAGLYNAGYVIPKSGALFEEYRACSGIAPPSEDNGNPNRAYEELMEAVVLNPAHPARAALETMSANVRSGIQALREALEDYAGAALLLPPGPACLVLSGGQAKSRLWNQLKADLTGAVLLVPEIPDGELAGDAALGAMYLESGDSAAGLPAAAPCRCPQTAALRETARRMTRIAERYEPRST